jgi:dihydroflavonol-4-reductase
VSRHRTWLVTGATGFLGRHLVRELMARGDRVRVLLRQPPAEPLPSGVEIAHGDVTLEESLGPAMDGVDGVFHLAGKVQRDGARDLMFALHVDAVANVLRAMSATGVKRIVLASTSGTVAVSKQPRVFDDYAPYAADVVKDWPYYVSKIHGEQVAKRMATRLGLELVVLRPSLILGPDDFGRSSTDDLRRYIQGDYPIVPKGGVSFVDVRDCAATFANAMDRADAGETYLLGGANMTMRDFFTLVANVADVEPPVAELPDRLYVLGREAIQAAAWIGLVEKPDRASVDMAAHYWYCDWSRAVADLGHATRSPIETLEDTVAWLQAYGDLPADTEPGKLLRLPFRPRVG